MSFLETKYKKKSAVITSIILALILVGIFSFGMQYLDPPQEYGLAINFGDSNVGNGDSAVKTKPTPAVKKVEEKPVVIPKETSKEKVITQKTKDAPIIEKQKEEKQVKKPKATPKLKPKPSKATQEALNNLLKGNSDTGKPKGKTTNSDVKGNKKGDPKFSKYYGNTGSDGDKNYNLAGRNALFKPIEKPKCNEEGIVVVSIEVDKKGKVIKAVPGVKGSTNTAPCLLKPAMAAALKTKWNLDENAPTTQKGTIIYRFSLSE